MLSGRKLRRLLRYDAETGKFYWRVAPSPRVKVGGLAGCKSRGYILIRIDGVLYQAHRLAWLYTYGAWPDKNKEIDHINGIPGDNRIVNLRASSHAQNTQNTKRRKNVDAPFRGVHRMRNWWQARIMAHGIRHHLGTFATPEEANAAYKHAARRLHGEFRRAECSQ